MPVTKADLDRLDDELTVLNHWMVLRRSGQLDAERDLVAVQHLLASARDSRALAAELGLMLEIGVLDDGWGNATLGIVFSPVGLEWEPPADLAEQMRSLTPSI